MLLPDSDDWNTLFSSLAPWLCLNIAPSASSHLHEYASRVFEDLPPRFPPPSLDEERETLASFFKRKISGPTCLFLEPGVHEMPLVRVDSVYPIIFKSLRGSSHEFDPENASRRPQAVLVGGGKTEASFVVSGPGGVLVEDVGFASDSLSGCVALKEGPAKFVNCFFRTSSRAKAVYSVLASHHASFLNCSFDRGDTALRIEAPFLEDSNSDVEIRVESSQFLSSDLNHGIVSCGNARVLMSNVTFNGISGVAFLSSGKTSGYIKDSFFSDVQGTGIVIECLSTLWVKQCTFERCAGDQLRRTSKNNLLPTAGAIVVAGAAAPTLVGNSIRDCYLIQRRRQNLSSSQTWNASRMQILFCSSSRPRFTRNEVKGIEVSANDLEGHGDVRFTAQPSACSIAVTDDSSPIIDSNSFECWGASERPILLEGFSSAKLINNTISRHVCGAFDALYCIRLGPCQKSKCAGNTLVTHDELSGSREQPMASVYASFETPVKILDETVFAEYATVLPNYCPPPPNQDGVHHSPKPPASSVASKSTASQLRLPTSSNQENSWRRAASVTGISSRGKFLRQREGLSQKRLPSATPSIGARNDRALSSEPTRSSSIGSFGSSTARTPSCPSSAATRKVYRQFRPQLGASQNGSKSLSELEKEVAQLNVVIAQLKARLRFQPKNESASNVEQHANRSLSFSSSIVEKTKEEGFEKPVRVGKYVWDYSKIKAFHNQEVSLKDVRRRLSVFDAPCRENVPRRLHDQWLEKKQAEAEERRQQDAKERSLSPRLTRAQEKELAHRLHDEGCEHQREARERAREVVLASQRSHTENILPLTEEEVNYANHRLYYEQVRNREELMFELRCRYDRLTDDDLKCGPLLNKRPNKSPRPPSAAQSQDIETSAVAL